MRTSMEQEEIIDRLKAEGYSVVIPWHAEPGEVDFEHAHPTDSAQIVLEGSIIFAVDGEQIILIAGESYAIPARTSHSAVAGPEGCSYIFAIR